MNITVWLILHLNSQFRLQIQKVQKAAVKQSANFKSLTYSTNPEWKHNKNASNAVMFPEQGYSILVHMSCLKSSRDYHQTTHNTLKMSQVCPSHCIIFCIGNHNADMTFDFGLFSCLVLYLEHSTCHYFDFLSW